MYIYGNKIYSKSLILASEKHLYIFRFFNTYWGGIFTPIIGAYGLYSVTILSTLIIPKKILRMSIWDIDRRLSSKSIETLGSNNSTGQNIGFQNIFKNEQLLELFVSHLIKEFCQENIIAYIELKQFRDIFLLKSNINDDTNAPFLYELAMDIPKSQIVFNQRFNIDNTYTDHELKNLSKLIFIDFYNKYIDSYASYGVNISYPVRNHYDNIYQHTITMDHDSWNLELNEILKLYDDILHTMIKLLRQSKHRFIRSSEYLEYIKQNNK